MPAIISIVGKKGSGKADVLQNLIQHLKAKGFRIGVLKNLKRDDIEIDEAGTDTYEYRMKGAETVILAGRKRFAMFSNLEESIPFEKLLNHFKDFDFVFLEGYVENNFPKIEVHKKELGELLLSERETNVIAVCSDGLSRPDAPSFGFNQIDQLTCIIEEQILCPTKPQ